MCLAIVFFHGEGNKALEVTFSRSPMEQNIVLDSDNVDEVYDMHVACLHTWVGFATCGGRNSGLVLSRGAIIVRRCELMPFSNAIICFYH